jgi:predicted transcriptional regulator
MKVQIAPDGTVTVEVASVADALEVVAAMKAVHGREAADGVELSPDLMAAWEVLVSREAMTAHDLAHALSISAGAASQRLSKLVKHGLADRPQRGVYRRIT